MRVECWAASADWPPIIGERHEATRRQRVDVGWDWQSNSGIDRVSEVAAEVPEVAMMAPTWLRLRATYVAWKDVAGSVTPTVGVNW